MALIEAERLSSPAAQFLSAPSRTFVGPWQLCGGALAILAFCMAYVIHVPDFDYWGHLADGRFIVATHRLPVPNPFSFTAGGGQWVAHEWLTEVAMYMLHRVRGDRGPLMLFGLCTAVAIALTLSTLRRTGARFLAANTWTLLTLAALFGSIGPRPEVAAFALMAADMWLIERWIACRDRCIWLLPLLMCLWVNVHGSWPAGVALPVLLLCGDLVAGGLQWQGAARLDTRSRIRLGAVVAVSLAAVFINANGIAGVLYPVTHFHSPLNDRIAGNGATALSTPNTWPFFVLAGSYLAMVVIRRPRLPAADLLIGAAFLMAALWTWRLVPFAAICLAPLAGRVLARKNESGATAPPLLAKIGIWHNRWEQRVPRPSPGRQALNAVILLALAAFALSRPPYDVARAGRQPVDAVNALRADGLSGLVFNQDQWGGYLIWRLWPEKRVFVDDRGVDLYTNGQVLQHYLDVFDRKPDAEAVMDSYGIQSALVPEDWPPVRDLLASGKWRITYRDNVAVKLERGP